MYALFAKFINSSYVIANENLKTLLDKRNKFINSILTRLSSIFLIKIYLPTLDSFYESKSRYGGPRY